jgi:hypothetical protein
MVTSLRLHLKYHHIGQQGFNTQILGGSALCSWQITCCYLFDTTNSSWNINISTLQHFLLFFSCYRYLVLVVYKYYNLTIHGHHSYFQLGATISKHTYEQWCTGLFVNKLFIFLRKMHWSVTTEPYDQCFFKFIYVLIFFLKKLSNYLLDH